MGEVQICYILNRQNFGEETDYSSRRSHSGGVLVILAILELFGLGDLQFTVQVASRLCAHVEHMSGAAEYELNRMSRQVLNEDNIHLLDGLVVPTASVYALIRAISEKRE
ncbi:hypothetical protein BT96DRAFT_977095 [Gymnopus androsaceus JB14]|uniref:Uncharacterized protein n=1 Tax=Gymnopus androsaceus JB14 TaxID=1447944 RepID=A0A6A4HH79_9AGAR|nr:hypothetical protein BT96DRAFT_977095 [Gymnopus androsaceus JB14]